MRSTTKTKRLANIQNSAGLDLVIMRNIILHINSKKRKKKASRRWGIKTEFSRFENLKTAGTCMAASLSSTFYSFSFVIGFFVTEPSLYKIFKTKVNNNNKNTHTHKKVKRLKSEKLILIFSSTFSLSTSGRRRTMYLVHQFGPPALN